MAESSSKIYVDGGYLTRGARIDGIFVGMLLKVTALAGFTFAANHAITFARRYPRVQEFLKSMHLPQKWDWLVAAGVGGVPVFLIIDRLVNSDVTEVHRQLNAAITARDNVFGTRVQADIDYKAENQTLKDSLKKIEADNKELKKKNDAWVEYFKNQNTTLLSQSQNPSANSTPGHT